MLSLFLGLTGVRLCAFVPFHAMRLMNIGTIDETPKGPPVEALVQWQARTRIHMFEVGVLFVPTCGLLLLHSFVSCICFI